MSAVSPVVPAQSLALGRWAAPVEARLEAWGSEGFGRRLWARDPTLWAEEPVPELTNRLGWLDLPAAMASEVDGLAAFAREVAGAGVEVVALLAMGGSSLAPEVFQATFGERAGRPRMLCLDSTHPAAVRAVESRLDPARTLFLVSSKSGTTAETMAFFHYFWQVVAQRVERPGQCFAAISDPGTPLAELARERRFRRLFEAPAEVGGRYSALSPFGLVPAALIGLPVGELLARGHAMAQACGAEQAVTGNPGLILGATLAELARLGRDKLTLLTTAGLSTLPDWIEQLVAESTGKVGQGIVPVAHEPALAAAGYGDDRLFVATLLAGDPGEAELAERLAAIEAAGHPVVRIRLADRLDVAAEMFRWELAVAAAGAALGVQPFDQPDVEIAKQLTRIALAGGGTTAAGELVAVEGDRLTGALAAWLGSPPPAGYLAIHAYLAPDPETDTGLARLQGLLRAHTGLAVTVGYGPRFLHSTGQLHKGGPSGVLVLQLVDDAGPELPVPGSQVGFARLIAAQAAGDAAALTQRGRRLLRVDLGEGAAAGIERLAALLERVG